MSPADQISLASSMTIPQLTTPPMAHHDRPPSESDSIYLDPKSEPLSQPPYNQDNGELFLLSTCKFVTHVVIIGWHISKHFMRTFLFIFHRLNEMRGFKTHSRTEPTRIPTFFPFENDDDDDSDGLLIRRDHSDTYRHMCDHCRVAIISLLFGLIHCLGWSLVFPSVAERLVWRVSAVIIAALPVLILFLYSLGVFFFIVHFEWLADDSDLEDWRSPKRRRRQQLRDLFSDWIVMPTIIFRRAIWWIFVILIPIYLLARMALLVEAFLSLRSLPSGAYSVVNWTEYLPHI